MEATNYGSEIPAPDLLVFDHEILAQRDYWIERLSGLGRSARIAFEGVKDPTSADPVMELTFDVHPAAVERLDRLTRGSSFLLFTTLLSTLEVMLGRSTGEHQVVVGSAAHQPDGSSDQSPNALAILIDFDARSPFQEILLATRQKLLDAYDKQQYPFTRLLRDLGRSAKSGQGLFDVALSLEGLHSEMPEVGQLLAIRFEKQGQNLRGRVRAAGRLGASTVRRWLGRLRNALHWSLENMKRPVAELDLLWGAERHQVLTEWNDTTAGRPFRTVLDLFEDQVRRKPGSLAVTTDGESLSYRELDSRANVLARRLRSLGVGRGDVVAILAEPSVRVVVGIVSALKTGAAYLPVDPAYPRERLRFIAADSKSGLLLSDAQQREHVSELARHPLDLDEVWPELDAADPGPPPTELGVDDLAYVIYTSGSTGRPKGVAISHLGLANLATWHVAAYGVTPEDRTTQVAGLGFDASVWEMWPCLVQGASLHIVDEETRAEPQAMVDYLAAREITISFLPTPLAEMALEKTWPGHAALRTLLTGGDKLRKVPREAWPFRYVNHYGPTESSVVATCGPVEPDRGQGEMAPIGRPVANVRVHLADRFLKPLPVGIAGELLVGGLGLGRGYLHRPRLTAERFVPDPFAAEAGERLYKTGDMARYLAGGEITFQGRIDHQVKLRGYRIELGEIEASLAQHAAVREAVVVARGNGADEKRLIAYVRSEAGQEVSAADLRGFLRDRLPEYMVPATFMTLASFPLTAHGKVDRRALPVPDSAADPQGAEMPFHAPRSGVEEDLADIFAEVLKRERIGIHDNFFDLGGHSLLATQVMSRIRNEFQVKLPLRTLFQKPTVAEVAADLARELGTRCERTAPEITPVDRRGRLPLSFAQQRLWFLDQLRPGNTAYHMRNALRLEGSLDVATLQRAFDEVRRRHEILRTRFPAVEGEPFQDIEEPRPLSLEVRDFAELAPEERQRRVQQQIAEERRRAFDLACGPLFRVTLIRLGAAEHILVLTQHHIISDGWSMGILVRELVALYEAFAQGRPSPLPEPPIQYADFAVWQRQHMEGQALGEGVDYWRRHLANAPERLALPVDRERPEAPSYRGARCHFELSPELSRKLNALSRAEDASLYMTLLAAFGLLLSRYSRQEDLVVGMPIANRNRLEVEGLIGFFVNILPLRLDLAKGPTFRRLLARVRHVTLNGFAHQDVPLEKLVEELRPQRDGSGDSPLFQVTFGVQNAPRETFRVPGLELSPFPAAEETTRFDLTLWMWESEDGLRATWTYSTDLFEEATIRGMHGRFASLLTSIVERPDAEIGSLDMSVETEERERSARQEALRDRLLNARPKGVRVAAT